MNCVKILVALKQEVPDMGRPVNVDPVSYNWGYREALREAQERLEEAAWEEGEEE